MEPPKKQQRPFGLWPGALSPASLAATRRFLDARITAEEVVWVESRGKQSVVLAQRAGDAPRELTVEVGPRGGVGYGGGELAVHRDAFFFPGSDGRLYRGDLGGGQPRALTPPFGKLASPTPSPDGVHVAYVHTHQNVDVIAIVDALGKRWPIKLVDGADFYMQPAWHPEQTHLAWIAWDQPQMPWDGARLEMARVHIGAHGARLGEVEVLAGGESVAVQQPVFSPDGRWLAFLSDASGWTQVYVRDMQGGTIQQLSSEECEHATPGWVQGLRHIAWLADSSGVLSLRHARGVSELWCYTLLGKAQRVPGLEGYTSLSQLSVNTRGEVVVLASSSTVGSRVVKLDDEGLASVVSRAGAELISARDLSVMLPVSWRAADGAEIFGNLYPPASSRFEGSGLPPAIVMIHGGPTAQAPAAWSARNQFFATRGYVVLDVNYRGSTGYGRAYMEALRGQWGVHDVADAVSAAKYLADAGLADASRIAILGGSAGGYTVLHTLVKHPGVFAAGVSLYGISNLFTLVAGTHKFEAAYNDSLIGALPGAAAAYRERSPIFAIERLSDPLAVFQGDEDDVVPPEQAEQLVASLRARGVPHLYHVYAGEGHGWRKPETIEHFYRATLEFLTQHLIYK